MGKKKRNNWMKSTDVTPLNFFLFSHVKNWVYVNWSRSIAKLEERIRIQIANIGVF
jgi:hypothetical protein